jgi:anaerobic ribonucleoside-triphosphate reductase
LVLAHRLADGERTAYLANLAWRKQTYASYSAVGSRFDCDWKGDWELDTLRMGSVDSVLVNLPRLTYECEGNTSKFMNCWMNSLRWRLELWKSSIIQLNYEEKKDYSHS